MEKDVVKEYRLFWLGDRNGRDISEIKGMELPEDLVGVTKKIIAEAEAAINDGSARNSVAVAV